MAIQSVKELRDNPGFDSLSNEAKIIAFGRVSTGDANYLKLSEEAQGIVKQRLLGAPQPSARQFGSAVEGGPVESDVFPEVLREHPTAAGAVGVASGFAELAGNIPASTLELGKDIFRGLSAIVTDPVEVGKGLTSIASGAIEAALPGFQGGSKKDMAAFNAVADAVKGRYGSLEAFSESAIQNPAGVAQDLSILAGGLGLVSKAPLAVKAATILDPVSAAGVAVSRGVAAVTPVNRLIKAAVTFDLKKPLQRVDELANAFVEKGLNVNRKSLARMDADLKAIGNKIEDMVVKTTDEGVTILTKDITKAMDDLIENAARNGLEFPDVRAIQKMKEDFVKLHGEVLTVKQAQDIKVGYGKAFDPRLAGKFGQIQKKVRDTIRDTTMLHLEELHPGLKQLNADWGVTKELLDTIEKQVKKVEGAKFVNVGGLAAGGFAGGIAGTAKGLGAGLKFGAAAIAVDKVIESARVQIMVNKALNRVGHEAARVGKLIPPTTKTLSQVGRVERNKPIEVTP